MKIFKEKINFLFLLLFSIFLFLFSFKINVNAAHTLIKDSANVDVVTEGTESDSTYSFTLQSSNQTYFESWGYNGIIRDFKGNKSSLAVMPTNDNLSGKIGCWIYNAGYYQGNPIDVKCTYYWKPLYLNGTHINPFIYVLKSDVTHTINFGFATSSYEVKYETYSNGKPINVNMSLTFQDIDFCQFFGFKSNTGNINKIQVRNDAISYYRKTNGYDWFYSKNVSSLDTPESSVRIELANTSSFNIIYGQSCDEWSYVLDRYIPTYEENLNETNEQVTLGNQEEKMYEMVNNVDPGRTSFGWAFFNALAYGPYSVNNPTKKISDTNESNVTSNTLGQNESFKYNISYFVPFELEKYYYQSFSLSDTLPQYVTFKQAKVYNDRNIDVSNQFNISKNGQTITASKKDTNDSSFYGTGYRLEIEVTLNSNIIHSKNFSFNNTGKVTVGRFNTSVVRNSNTVTSYYPIVDKRIIKLWDDLDDADGLRTSIIVNLKNRKTNQTIKSVVLTKDNSYQQTIQDLPMYNSNGQVIDYVFEEVTPNEYEKISQTVSGDTTTITNKHHWTRTTATVSKVWDDLDDADGIRPDEITVALKSNGKIVPEYNNIKLNEGNNWTATVSEIPMNQKGKKINYTFEEVTVPNGYQVKSNVTTDKNTVITNYHEWKKTDLKVNKQWLDGQNADGLRPFRVEVDLTANGEVLEKDIYLSEANSWTYETKQLPLNKKGKRIEYEFHEKVVPEGYTVNYDKRDTGIEGVTTKTNTTITNSHDYGKISVRVKKYWKDNNNADGLRPDSIEVKLIADGKELNKYTLNSENEWSTTVDNLPKEIDGKKIQYEFKEINKPEGYTAEYEVKENTTQITNTHIHEVKTISVEKIWKDGNNADGLRPSNIEVELLANDKEIESFNLSKENEWKVEIYNLPVKEKGKQIKYEFREKTIPEGYSVKYEEKDNKTKITNTHNIETTNVEVEKIWKDGNNADAIRPDSIEVELFANESKVGTYTLTAQENWELEVTDLPVKANGEKLTYRFKEKGKPVGYEVNYQQEGNKTIITNTHEIEKTTASVEKIWKDENDYDGFRPKEVRIVLYGNNKPVLDEKGKEIEVVISNKTNWEYQLANLPKNEKGNKIQYRFVLKENIPHYTSRTEYKDEINHSIITSVHIPEKVNLKVEKIWNDNNNADGIRPESITVELKQNGVNLQNIVLNEENHWKTEIQNLRKYKEGKELEYTFKEKTIPENYEVSYKTEEEKTIITNTHKQELISLEVKKEWEDNYNQDNLRPDNLYVKLYADNEEIKEVKLNNKNDWSATIENLPKNKKGKVIQYHFEESEIPVGYEANYETIGNKTIIRNVHELGKTAVTIQKIWNDNNNQDGLRPNSIDVKLFANDKEIKTITLNNSNNWKTVIDDLPLNENGVPIDYEVKEISKPEGYTTNIVEKGGLYEITNTHIPETTIAQVEKIWIDENNLDGVRPEEVEVVLFKNGKATEQRLILSEKTNWKGEIENLPKYEDGEKIKYNFVLKESIPEYTTTYEQKETLTKITSVHKIPKINLTVEKIWNDKNNADGLRPQTVEIGFYVNGIQQQVLELNELNNWTITMSNLRQFINNKPVTYEFVELTKVDGYTTETIVKDNKTIITNTHIPETTIAQVEKIWIDNNNSDGVRPEEVEVILFKNGEPTEQSLILSEQNHWKGQLENLIKKENGKEIQYSFVLKENIPEYSTTYEQKETLTKITSVHDSIKTEASVKKVWDDKNSSKRPESIIVILCKNGKETEKQVLLSEENNWQATISDLLKYENGKEIEYSFIEKEIPEGYTNKVETNETLTVITNTLERPIINNPDTEDRPIKEPEETIKETITEKPNKTVEKTDGNASPVKTGDTTGIIILLLLCVVSGIGLYRKNKKDN